MKKLLAALLALMLVCTMAFSLVACGDDNDDNDVIPEVGLSYAEYMAAEKDSTVTIDCYVQAHQSWWDNKITVYAQDDNGGYFIYNMQCSETDAAKLVPGTKIIVTGTKGEWAGEIEIMNATFTFADDANDTKVYSPVDLTSKLDSDDLINYQNQKAKFTDMTIKAIEYKNGGGDDIYVTLTKDGKDYSFCVEYYLTNADTDVYKAFATINVGDVVDIEGFVYWYSNINTHITSVTVK